MKKLAWVFLLACLSISICSADNLLPTPALQNGSANYQETLDWAKQRIIEEAKKDYSAEEIQSKLQGFPLINEEKCGAMDLIFISNSPQCGNVNCPFLVFRKNPQASITTYRYIDEIWFAGMRLYCFPHDKDFKYYLVTSYHDSAAVSFLELNEIKQDHIQKIKNREVNYTQKDMNTKMDLLWDKKLDEQALLNFFKDK